MYSLRRENSVLVLAVVALTIGIECPLLQQYQIYNTEAFTITHVNNHNYNRYIRSTKSREDAIRIFAVKVKQSRTTKKKEGIVDSDDDDDEKPAGIVGAQFFGGNKEKEIFYDPVAEMEAGLELTAAAASGASDFTTYDRFADRTAFSDVLASSIAESLQDQINHVLFADETIRTSTPTKHTYAPNLQWDTMFTKTSPPTTVFTVTPLQELETALNFYRRLNVAIICGNTMVEPSSTTSSSSSVVQLRWEISVLWPTLWEPRIVLTGVSTLTINTSTNQILQQTDRLDDSDLLPAVLKQFFPRFWDMYHIGMTPAAEISPIIPVAKKWNTILTTNYQLYEIPPRIVVQASIYDSDDRDDSNASIIPNHAFTCVVKTMGPGKQFYTATTGVQVRLVPTKNNNQQQRLQIQWYVPIATEYVSNPLLQLPPPTTIEELSAEDDIEVLQPTCQYTFVPRRFVASVPYSYSGSAQDKDITKVRKQLYDQILKDGYTPKMENNRPIFFFTMNSIKACYTNEGLGMAVYEWRPQFTTPNEIGIELEI